MRVVQSGLMAMTPSSRPCRGSVEQALEVADRLVLPFAERDLVCLELGQPGGLVAHRLEGAHRLDAGGVVACFQRGVRLGG